MSQAVLVPQVHLDRLGHRENEVSKVLLVKGESLDCEAHKAKADREDNLVHLVQLVPLVLLD